MLLRRQPYRDRNDLVEGIGYATGRVSAVVSGARGGRSTMGGLLEPPVRLQVRLREGRTLYTLTQPLLRDAFLPLRRELPRLLVAGFLSRLFLASLVERAPEPEIFDLLVRLFEGLEAGRSPRVCGLWGQQRLLRALGLEPVLDRCVRCGSGQPEAFSAPEGGVLCRRCCKGDGLLVSGSGLSLCERLRGSELEEVGAALEPADVRFAGWVYRELFRYHLDLPAEIFRRVLPRQERR